MRFVPGTLDCASILLLMQLDPMENWRRLSAHYAEMSDGELIALAEDFGDLTDIARQVLRDEMRKRNLGDPQSLTSAPFVAADAQGNFSPGANAEGDGVSPDEFVWKNILCECHDREEAREIREVLRGAGIESWLDSPLMYSPIPSGGRRVLVASDRLEEARAILSQPIAQHIIEETKAAYTGYQPPVCPACGSPDPLLESVDPANCWKCEVCGKEWTEAVQESA